MTRLALLLAVSLVCASLATAQGGVRRDSTRPPATPGVVEQGRIDPSRDVNFSALVTPRTIYVGQQATYEIGVFLGEEVRQRLRRNPEFVPPDVRSMVAYDLPTPTRPLTRMEGGERHDVHVFQRALFPLTAGTHTIAPARLTYALPLSNSFFSREESHTVRTSSFTIIARDPPEAGRPVGFNGAVGQLALSAAVDTASGRVGVPLVLRISVQGVGNVSLLPRPEVALPWGETVPGAERVVIDTTSRLVQGRKDFDWVVTPRHAGNIEIPALRYPYWNPYTERYEVALSRPIALRVTTGTLVATPATVADSEPTLPLRLRYRGEIAEPFSTSPAFWFALAALPLPALVLGAVRRPRRRRHVASADRVQRFAAGAAHSAPELRRAFADAITERTGVRGASMTDGRALIRALRRVGVTTESASGVQRLLAELDQAVYGGRDDLAPTEAAVRARAALRAVDEEATPAPLRRGHHREARIATVLVCCATLGTVGWALASDGREGAIFREGVASYDRGDYQGAMRAFSEIVGEAPRAADAWANLGTAAWQANDTATAAIGWQRALRLEPLAADARGRLEQTPGFRGGLLGDIPPVPLDAAAALGALLWATGWGGLAVAAWRRDAVLQRAMGPPLAAAVAVGLGTIALGEVLSGRDRVVVVAPEPLRAAPALVADPVGEVVAGETGRELGAQGVWRRIRLPDGRTGWIDARRVASLDLSRAP